MPGIAVIGAQWGDEGKGKIAHRLAREADMAVRFNGGTNAGHTVAVANGEGANGAQEQEFKFHLVPSGALHDGCVGVLGNGMVLEPLSLAEEIQQLHEARSDQPEIRVSAGAHLILPYHPMVERLEGAQRDLDTTAKGIGPAYQDKIARRGLRAAHLRQPEVFVERVTANVELFRSLYPDSEALRTLDPRAEAERLLRASEGFVDAITDTIDVVNGALDEGQTVVFEGAQGTLLDVEFGTYPYVTSSYATIGGVGVGAGVSPRRLDRVIGLAKAFTSRVGAGPFPTEDTGEIGDRLRGTGENPWDEYGTTTGRPRRCGWLDLVALGYAARLNGFTELALVKLDVLSGLDELKVATAYRHDGQTRETFPNDATTLEACTPVYETLPGWSEDITRCRAWEDLPANAQRYIQYVEQALGVPVSIISVGRASDATIDVPQ